MPHTAANPSATCEVAGPPYRVLLVEDNPTNLRLMRRLLEGMHCQVDVAMNGREAVTKTAASRYEVIFMDCHMPVMDGYDATAEIRLSHPSDRLPIIAVTASIVPDDHHRCQQVGMNQVITKPIEPEQIRQALARWCPRPRSDAGGSDPAQPEAA